MKTTETLSCVSCNGTRFYNLVNLKAHPNGGTGPTPIGYRCADCSADVDVAKMMQKAERARRLKELQDLQDELEPSLAPEPAKSGKTSK